MASASPAQPAQTLKTEARVSGGALVVSFSGPGLPRVWRADLAHLSTAALELREEAGKIILVLKTPAGTEEVYAFADRDSAALALKTVTQALFAGDRAAAAAMQVQAPRESGGFFGRFFKIVFYCLLLLIAIGALGIYMKPKPADVLVGAATGTGPVKAGVPVPAEQLFGK